MSGDRLATALVAVLLCLPTLGGCGGESGGTEIGNVERVTSATPEAKSAAIKQANDNCDELLQKIEVIGRRARTAAYGTSLVTVTESLAKPATRLVKQISRRQRSLEQTVDDPQFDLYVNLFYPIIVLAEERVQAGLAEQATRSQRLQYLLTNLSDEQRLAARRAGLQSCEVDFFSAMVRAYGG